MRIISAEAGWTSPSTTLPSSRSSARPSAVTLASDETPVRSIRSVPLMRTLMLPCCEGERTLARTSPAAASTISCLARSICWPVGSCPLAVIGIPPYRELAFPTGFLARAYRAQSEVSPVPPLPPTRLRYRRLPHALHDDRLVLARPGRHRDGDSGEGFIAG